MIGWLTVQALARLAAEKLEYLSTATAQALPGLTGSAALTLPRASQQPAPRPSQLLYTGTYCHASCTAATKAPISFDRVVKVTRARTKVIVHMVIETQNGVDCCLRHHMHWRKEVMRQQLVLEQQQQGYIRGKTAGVQYVLQPAIQYQIVFVVLTSLPTTLTKT